MVSDETNSEPSPDEVTETHHRVKVPTGRMIKLRELEPGMKFCRDVLNNSGQLLYPEGTQVDENIIRRLRDFKKHLVPIQDYKTKWVDENEYKMLSSEAERLDTREVPVKTETVPGTHPKSGEEKSTSDKKVAQSIEAVDEIESLEDLEKVTQQLIELAPADDLEGDLHSVLEDFRGHEEDYDDALEYLILKMAKDDQGNIGQRLLDQFEKTEENPDLLDIDPPEAQELMIEFERLLDEQEETKHELKTALYDFIDDFDNADLSDPPIDSGDEKIEFTSFASGDQPDSLEERMDRSKKFLDKVLRNDDKRRSSLSVIGEILEEQSNETVEREDIVSSEPESFGEETEVPEELEGGDLEAIEKALENLATTGDPPGSNQVDEKLPTQDTEPSDSLDDALEAFDLDKWSRAIEVLKAYLENELSGNVSMQKLDDFFDRSSQLDEQKNSIVENFLEALPLEDEQEVIDEHLNRDRSENNTKQAEANLSDEELDNLESYFENREDFLSDLWKGLGSVLPEIEEAIKDSDQEGFLERFQGMNEQMILEKLRQPIEESPYETKTPGGELDEKVKERLKDAVEQGVLSEIKQVTPLQDSVIEKFDELYKKPRDINKWQKKLLDRHKSLFDELIYCLDVPEDSIKRFLDQFDSVYGREKKPFSLFLQPPSTSHYHLVHSYNTSLLCLMICRELELPETVREEVYLGATFADIGLTFLPDSLYLNEGSLSWRAKNEMRKHPIYSGKIVSKILGSDHTVTNLVQQHHERLDGSGYPRAVEDEDISLLTSVLTVADVYTALIEERSYRSARMPDEALKFFEERDDQFNRKIIGALREAIGIYPNGSVVKLSNDRLAFVRAQNEGAPGKPRVLYLTDGDRNRLDQPEEVDLSETSHDVKLVLRT